MEPRLTLITLGVADLDRSVKFYRDGLGLPTHFKDGDPIAFFDLAGTKLSIFPIDELAHDISPEIKASSGKFSGITLAHNVRTREEVAIVLNEAHLAGAKILKPAQDVFWGGHSGYFADPDGHHWEVAWNPLSPLGPDGFMDLTPPA